MAFFAVNRPIMACTQILLPTGPLLLTGRPFDFWAGYGWFQKKISCRLISREIILARKYYSWRKKIPTLKKISLVAYDSGKKSYSAAVVCQEKKILSPAGLGEKILSPSNHPYQPLPINVEWSAVPSVPLFLGSSVLSLPNVPLFLCSSCFVPC